MKMNKYLNYLIEQYKQATGIKNVDVNSKEFISEFVEWINNRQSIGLKYLDFINNRINLYISGSDTAEIGKGKYDSIVKPLNTTIITPFSEGFKNIDNDRIITAYLKVHKNEPLLINENDEIKKITSIKTFMTQNPYTNSNTKNWCELHNSGKYNIIIGAYGNTYDHDIKSKISRLKTLKHELIEPYSEEIDVLQDTYYWAIATKQKYISKQKVRAR